MPHALLFIGPEGIGKRLTAFCLAKALLCEKSKDDFCDSCASCHRIDQGNHPDVSIIRPEGSSIKIDQLREWQNTIEARSYFGSWKITIIDQADKMSHSAANSILKILEEPSEDTLICLIALEVRNILPTIVSRCQIVRFAPLTRSDFMQVLMEKRSLTESQSGLIYNLSQRELTKALRVDLDTLFQTREQWKALLEADILNARPHLPTDQGAIREGLEIIAYWWRDIILLQMGMEDASLINQDMLDVLKKEARANTSRLAKYRINLILEAIEAIERNANPKMAIDSLLLQWDNKYI